MADRVFDSQQRYDLIEFITSGVDSTVRRGDPFGKIINSIYNAAGNKLSGVVVCFGYEAVIYTRIYSNLLPIAFIDGDNRVTTLAMSRSRTEFDSLCDRLLALAVHYAIDDADEAMDLKQDWEGMDYA